jgi:hypothetical protein
MTSKNWMPQVKNGGSLFRTRLIINQGYPEKINFKGNNERISEGRKIGKFVPGMKIKGYKNLFFTRIFKL